MDGAHGATRAAALQRLLTTARHRPDILALVALLVTGIAIGRGLNGGFLGLGVVAGAGTALQALALILVFRSDGIVNFAQVQLGATAAVVFSELVQRRSLLHAASLVCTPCVGGGRGAEAAGSTALAVDFWVALLLCVAMAAVLGFLVQLFIVRRLARAPRLVVTIATVAIAQLLAAVATYVTSAFDPTTAGINLSNAIPVPIPYSLTIGRTIFSPGEVAQVLAVLLAAVGLTLFLRRSRRGVAVRGAADNAQRAATLGIDVDSVRGVVWTLAGALSGIAACLAVTEAGVRADNPLDVTTLSVILAAVAIAGFRSLSLAVAGAMVLGILQQGIDAGVNAPDVFAASQLGVVSLFLLLDRRSAGRAEADAAAGWLAAREIRPVPASLRALPPVRTARRWGVGGLSVVLLAYPFVVSPDAVETGARVAVYAMVGISLLVIAGWGGQISLGQMAIAAVGAYVAALVAGGSALSFVAGLVLGAGAGAVASLLVGLPALRVRGLALAVSTLALGLTVSLVLLSGNYAGARLPETITRPTLLGFDLEDARSFYYLCLLILAGTVVGALWLRRTGLVRALIACRENEQAARALGITPAVVRLAAFAISGALAGMAGALFAYNEHGVRQTDLGPSVSIAIFLMVVIGGLGSVFGPVLGAVYIGALLASGSALLAFAGTGGVVLAVLFVAPGGFVQVLTTLRDAGLRRVALRYRVIAPGLLSQAALEGRAAAIQPLRAGRAGRAHVAVRYRLEPTPDSQGGATGGG